MMVMIMSNELATSSEDGDDYGTRSSGDDNDRVDADTDSSDD